MSWSCHIARCKNSIRHIGNRFSSYFIFFLFLMQFGLWWAAAFVWFPIDLLVFHWNCLYLVPFLRYSASKNRVTLKPGLGIVQDHWKWRHSIDHIRLSIGRPS